MVEEFAAVVLEILTLFLIYGWSFPTSTFIVVGP